MSYVPPASPVTVVRLEVDAFQRLRAAHVTPTATGLVPVRGRNAQGKSSLIGSMLDALGVEKSDLPITEGEHGGSVEIELAGENPGSTLIVREKITRDSAGKAKRSLTITAADGSKVKTPAAVLKELRGRFADPVAFLEMPAADQVKTVLHVLGLAAELQRLEDVAAEQYETRRDLGREADRVGKAAQELQNEVRGLPALPDHPEGLEGLTTALQQAKDHNARVQSLGVMLTTATTRGKELKARREAMAAQLAKLEKEIAETDEAIDQQRVDWTATKELMGEAGEPLDLEPILEEIRAHESAGKARARRELASETQREADEAKAEHAEAEAALEVTRTEIAQLLTGAPFPVEGMGYDVEAKTLTIGGIPFGQASQAERLKAAAAVAMSGSPAIRVLFAREGSLLDDESQALLGQLAEARGFQLWLEVVDSDPNGAGIWIEDGEASQG